MVDPTLPSRNPSVYRVDVVHDDRGSLLYHVVRCELVARFDSEEQAAFLVELLQRGQARGLSRQPGESS